MNSRRAGARALALVCCLLAVLLVPVTNATAASDYDTVVNPVGNLHLSRDGAAQGGPICASVDITGLWEKILVSPASWTTRTQIVGGATQSATLEDWATTLENNTGWAVVQQHNNSATEPNFGSSIADGVYVIFTPSATAKVSFSADAVYWGPQKQAYLTNADDAYVYSVRIQFDDLGGAGGDDRCTPVISTVVREPSSTPSYKEMETVAATSTVSAGGYDVRPMFVKAVVDYPEGYEGDFLLAESPLARYAALGDSFSGGEGVLPFETGTNEGGTNQCHRSLRSYPQLLQGNLALGPVVFVACGGAMAANIIGSGQWNEPGQLEALTESIEKVTVTIGGNDAALRPYLLSCVVACGPGTPTYDATLDGINQPAFGEVLEYTYERILEEAPNAQVYVGDYPYLSTSSVTSCWGLDFSGAYEVQTALNEAIQSAVENVGANNSRIHYVPTNYGSSPFAGGELCGGSGDSLFNGLMLPSEYSLHPNAAGQQAYAAVFEAAMS
jgi:lysophospholipase L1-like esterase